jgi:hypothetical protein
MAVDEKNSLPTKRLIITSLIAGLLLVIVNTAVWFNRQVFDMESFTETAVTSITSASSRTAISSRIVDEALKDNPVIKGVAGDRAVSLVSGLLDSTLADKLLTASVSKLQIYVTSKNQQDVDIDLTGLKAILTRVIEVSGNNQPTINTANIPDKIVIIQAKNVPDLYNYGIILTWLAPLGFLVAGALLALPYSSDRKHYPSIMTVQGILLVIVGLVSLLVGPLFRPEVLEPFQNANGRIVVGNLYDAFMSTFNSQTMILIYLGLLVCVVALIVRMYPRLKTLIK